MRRARALLMVAALGFIAQIFALQEQLYLPKVRATLVVSLPALAHQVVNLLWTVDWLRQQDLKSTEAETVR